MEETIRGTHQDERTAIKSVESGLLFSNQQTLNVKKNETGSFCDLANVWQKHSFGQWTAREQFSSQMITSVANEK